MKIEWRSVLKTDNTSAPTLWLNVKERGWRYSPCLWKQRENMRKTVRSLSAVSVGYLRESAGSTRGLRWGNPWCASCSYQGQRWV